MDSDLAHPDPAQRAGVLIGRAHGISGRLRVTGLVHHQDHRPVQVTGDPPVDTGQDWVGVPDRPGQQVLQLVRTLVTDDPVDAVIIVEPVPDAALEISVGAVP